MAESEQQQQEVPDVEEEDNTPNVAYKPPATKSINEILATDEADESLRKYKEQLLGAGADIEGNTFWPEEKKNVILRKMSVMFPDFPDNTKEIDLNDSEQLKNMKFVIQEGVQYQLKIGFNVQREIVSGLKLVNKVSRGPIVDKTNFMVGSYGPKKEVHEFKTPPDFFPKGMVSRGTYKAKSLFTDDDGNELLKWEWSFELKKDWKEK